MKKNIALLLLSLAIASGTFGQLKLTGQLIPSPNWEPKLYVLRIDRIGTYTPTLVDSIPLKGDGSFSYAFESDPQGIIYQFRLPPNNQNHKSLRSGFDDNWFLVSTEKTETLKITGSMDSLFYSVKIEGGDLNKKLLTFREFKRPFANLTRQLVDSIKKDPKRTEEFQRKLIPIAMSYAKEASQKTLNVLDTTNITTLKLAGLFYSNDANFGQLPRELVEKAISGIEVGKILLIKNLMNQRESINRVGIKFPNVTLPKPNDKKASLSEIPGEFKVIDFWASWCGPCRKANRTELPEFNKYLIENHIPLIAISIDTDKQKWKQAIKTDATTWGQFIDDQNLLSQVLHIQGVPQYLVLNKENVVVFESNILFSIKIFLEKNGSSKDP